MRPTEEAWHDLQQEQEGKLLGHSVNAMMERFFLNQKMERVWQRDYANHGEISRDIREYIVGFYNCLRLHSTLGNLPPLICEMQLFKKLRNVYE
jgi:hypothetical protein